MIMRKIFLFAAVLLSAVLLKTSTFIVSCTEIDPYSDSEYVEDDILNEVLGNDDLAEIVDFEESDKLEVERAMKAAREAELLEKGSNSDKKTSRTKTKNKNRAAGRPGGTIRTPQNQQQQQQKQQSQQEELSKTLPNMKELLNKNKNSGLSLNTGEFKMGGNRATMGQAGHGSAGAEQLVGEVLRARYEQAQQLKAEKVRASSLRKARFSVARKLAQPVEKILSLYNGPQEDWLPDMYAVLGVTTRANDLALKKAYRALALIVHPDKNPHPDAQAAFDALQDAYSTLTQSELRSQYDMDLARARKGRRLSIRRTRKLLNEWWVNLGGSCSLLRQEIAQVGGLRSWGRQKWGELKKAAGEWVAGSRKICDEWVEHMLLLPSAGDRATLFHEQFVRFLPATMAFSLLHSILLY